jgi:hypothetical protein
VRAALLLAFVPVWAATQPNDAIQRELILRDRQSAEFSRPELRDLHERQDQQHLPARPDERAFQARERDTYPRPARPAPPAASPGPLPLPSSIPRSPIHGVDPIPVQGPSH